MIFSKSKVSASLRRLAALFALGILFGCIEPTRPSFQLEEGFYLVEGRIVAGESQGELRIRASNYSTDLLRLDFVAEAEVMAVESGGATISWGPGYEPGRYVPPPGVTVSPGETWHFVISLPDGTSIRSEPETIPEPVTVNNLEIIFEQNSLFDDGLNRFLPRFELYLDYEDPADQANYYSYEYRYWEEVIVCASCEDGIWRNGECIPRRINSFVPRYDYLCATDECYSIKNSSQVRYGTDEFSNGNNVRGFPLGGIVFQAYGGLLVEGIVYSITEEAFAYGKVIQDLVNGNTGLNPTIPAALDGNVKNDDPEGPEVLGYIGAASAASAKDFVERTLETGSPLPFDNQLRIEPVLPPGVPPRAPCDIPGLRTSERPVGWP